MSPIYPGETVVSSGRSHPAGQTLGPSCRLLRHGGPTRARGAVCTSPGSWRAGEKLEWHTTSMQSPVSSSGIFGLELASDPLGFGIITPDTPSPPPLTCAHKGPATGFLSSYPNLSLTLLCSSQCLPEVPPAAGSIVGPPSFSLLGCRAAAGPWSRSLEVVSSIPGW